MLFLASSMVLNVNLNLKLKHNIKLTVELYTYDDLLLVRLVSSGLRVQNKHLYCLQQIPHVFLHFSCQYDTVRLPCFLLFLHFLFIAVFSHTISEEENTIKELSIYKNNVFYQIIKMFLK